MMLINLGHLLPREKASITQKHLRPKTQVLLFYPIFISTGFEIPLTLPEPVYCHILCL